MQGLSLQSVFALNYKVMKLIIRNAIIAQEIKVLSTVPYPFCEHRGMNMPTRDRPTIESVARAYF